MPALPTLVAGQAWSSEAEPELGVGFVRAHDAQTVTLEFPSAGQARRYGRRSAPLKRLLFREGDTVQDTSGKPFKIDRVEDRDGLLWYVNASQELPESAISPKLRLQRPLQRFLAGQWDSLQAFDLRARATELATRQAALPIRGMLGPRAQLLPHQLYVVDAISSRALPRALLADEVGLGKTIEAGWILHRLIVTGRVSRALIVVPQALVNQWFVELLRRFHLSFWVPSSQSDEEMTTEDYLEQQRLIIATESLSDPVVAAGILESRWDLVIVDEAHRIAWQQDSPSAEYRVLEAIAAQAPGLLLLTATPEQLGIEGHYARLKLIDPARFGSLEGFRKEHARYQKAAAEAEKLLAQNKRQEVLQLIDEHGTGRIYYRNSRQVVEREHCFFPKRELHKHRLKTEGRADEALVQWLGAFASQHRGASRDLGTPPEKTLLICDSAAKASFLERRLKEDFAIKAVVFHENLPLLARDRNAAYFEDPQGASILLSSEIGGEGRNFQHARHLILADLPEDPDLLEQRIGRLDRIGQKSDIQIHVPYREGSSEEILLRWHEEVFDAFKAPPKGANSVYGRFREELHQVLESGKGLDSILKKAAHEYGKTLREIESGRDRLIEIHSFDAEKGTELRDSIARAEKVEELQGFLESVFDLMGLHFEELGSGTWFVEAGDSAFSSYVPALPPEGLRFTYSRQTAIARDDLALMSWDHPLVTGLLEAVSGQEFGNVAVAAWNEKMLAVECRFTFEIISDSRWNLDEFFAPTLVRIVMDGPGNDLSSLWTPQRLREAIGPLPTNMSEMPKRLPADAFRRLLTKARAQAEALSAPSLSTARHAMESAIDAEIRRLNALRAKNGLVSEQELEWWTQRREVLGKAIASARLRLDSFLTVLPKMG